MIPCSLIGQGKPGKHLRTRSISSLDLKAQGAKERSWSKTSRKSISAQGGFNTISSSSNLRAGYRASLGALNHSFDDMVTSGALYNKKRYSEMGETRSMVGRIEAMANKNVRKDQEDVRSLHFSYSVTSDSRPPSRATSSLISGSQRYGDETDAYSTISDGVDV